MKGKKLKNQTKPNFVFSGIELNSNLGERIRLVDFGSMRSNVFMCKLPYTFFKLSSLTNKSKKDETNCNIRNGKNSNDYTKKKGN